MSSWPPRLDVRDYGVLDAVAFFEALSINRELAIAMLRRQMLMMHDPHTSFLTD